MNLLTGQADVGGCSSVPDRNGGVAAALAAHDIATRLRSVVLIGEPALCLRLISIASAWRAKGGGFRPAASRKPGALQEGRMALRDRGMQLGQGRAPIVCERDPISCRVLEFGSIFLRTLQI
ncbi:hypothetical protein QA633_43675 [Bradyrhizobium barranii]|uniref:hypothetical protein n=1 Tax=Bradyrhizobium barranii TaxID=2992140 RepID=UPI0024AF4353|nr:hypothetical protein [Bradyrhizobium barranii]WFT95074.1 hypothetical protein QA633_43675 [Bradyrhizobium barranii]